MGWGGEWAHFHLPLYPLYALVNRKVAIGNFPRHCSCSFDSIWLKPWQNWGSKKLSFSLGSESPQMKNDVCSNSSETTLLSSKNRPLYALQIEPKKVDPLIQKLSPLFGTYNSKTVGISMAVAFKFIASSFISWRRL